MDQIAQIQGREINDVFLPTGNILVPILETKRADIEKTKKETHQYGPTERHMLDVYYPPTNPTSGHPPILFFSYGGGFYMGARNLPARADIIYSNLGAFFSKRGLITVIPDYRLVDSGMRFPDAALDVRDAMQWVVDILQFKSDIYVLGHSAGAMNSAILLAGPYTFEDMPADMKDAVRLYYSGDAEAKGTFPLELLNLAKDEAVLTRRWLLGIAERDFPCLTPALEKFKEALTKKGISYDEFIAKGHNHVSPVLALETGQGEQWAEGVVNWIHATPA
ncbi:Alpha/Beta hydrolase protein [Desarmillaria tabescens]|uniref:Alpha/Beta hydrolase protein n=1 Tax=Armillaria tabescens TaxID=1929756 RepID=A0AA39TYS7_ARMTA|nr:Alpha/Beta hydrolase protein [Desarmillaria tabescens]KAK0470293.1 Alpha/Beta hydrolase protein [Desarmillaria tabescens]